MPRPRAIQRVLRLIAGTLLLAGVLLPHVVSAAPAQAEPHGGVAAGASDGRPARPVRIGRQEPEPTPAASSTATSPTTVSTESATTRPSDPATPTQEASLQSATPSPSPSPSATVGSTATPGAATQAGDAASRPERMPDLGLVVAEPKDLAIRIADAGKGARLRTERDGMDAHSSWYEARFERDRTGSRFYQGPVVMHNVVYVTRDVQAARALYQEQAALNDALPEAERRVGPKATMKESAQIGDEAAGISACERTCDDAGETYVHKRIVARIGNVVSVVYLWGYATEESMSDWQAAYFQQLVMGRSRAAAGAVPI